MKAIKIAVVIMSVLLIVGFGVVIYTISSRMSDGTLSQKSKPPQIETSSSEMGATGSAETEHAKVFGSSTIPVAPGCHLVDAQMQGGKVLMRFDGAVERGCQKVVLLSAETGGQIGEWLVKNTPENAVQNKE